MSAFEKIQPILGKNPEHIQISNSEIQTFKSCKRKWMLGVYYGLSPDKEEFVGPLPLGVRIHNALDHYYTEGVKDSHPMDEYVRLQNADNLRFADSPDASNSEAVSKFQKESELGRIILEGYLDWVEEEHADTEIEFIVNEIALRYFPEEFDGRVEIIGKIDALVRRIFSDTYAILDFKTAQHFKDYLVASHHSEQLPLYINLKNKTAKPGEPKVDGGRYRLLKKVKRTGTAKPPFYQDVDVRFNKKSLDAHWKRTIGTIQEILDLRQNLDDNKDHLVYAYPTQKMGWECQTCPFFKGCFMLDDGSDAEGFFTDFYVQKDPNARYDEAKESENE